ncbi:hypothetical protein [Amnimonas aquatica]|jgi:hypothetical protein|uniref:Lipoprotein n=1 Tax=Amnimonas aquatica TaxID=2094561 RepID=A0A2P6AUB3_9GAMM|nr:hypothetical protein [Amnimonas aquatica]PQA49441.1 hypothetical protein C5O18_02365 [Amnimonas aquatica]
MNRMRLFALTAVLLTLAGCATRERYESELQTWVGKNISAVMDAWGYPSGSFEAPSGNVVYVWDRQDTYMSGPSVQTGIYTGGRYSGFFTGFGFGSDVRSLRCQTYFEVDKQKTILTWRTKGNDCRK